MKNKTYFARKVCKITTFQDFYIEFVLITITGRILDGEGITGNILKAMLVH